MCLVTRVRLHPRMHGVVARRACGQRLPPPRGWLRLSAPCIQHAATRRAAIVEEDEAQRAARRPVCAVHPLGTVLAEELPRVPIAWLGLGLGLRLGLGLG